MRGGLVAGPDPDTLSWNIQSVRKRLSSLIVALSMPLPRDLTPLQELDCKLLELHTILNGIHIWNELFGIPFRDVKRITNYTEDLVDEIEYEMLDSKSQVLDSSPGSIDLSMKELESEQFQASRCRSKRKCAYAEEAQEIIGRVDELVGRKKGVLIGDGFLDSHIECKRGKVLREGEVLLSSAKVGDYGSSSLAGALTVKAKELGKNFDELTTAFALLSLSGRGIVNREQGYTPMARPAPSLEDKAHIIGRRKDVNNVLRMLLSEKNRRIPGISVLAVIGMGGLGKTTLAQLVYNHRKVRNHFDQTGWVCVSRNFDVETLTRSIIISVEKRYCDSSELSSLQRKLSDRVTGKSIFLVLDDVWNEEYSLWEALLSPLQSAQACQILVTSRNNEVARIVQTMPTYHLGYLAYEDCWSLFKKCVLQGTAQYDLDMDSDMVEIGKKIINKCRGLPLAIKTVGSVLSYNSSIDFWKEISNKEVWDLEVGNQCEAIENEILPVLKLSYDQMPKNLKLCFTIFSLFPKGYVFLKDDVIKLWISLEFLELDSTREPEEIGSYYFDYMLQRSLIEPIPHNKRLKGFVMHDLVHDLAQFVAGGEFKRAEAESSSTDNYFAGVRYMAQFRGLILGNEYSAEFRYVSIVVNNLPKTINLHPRKQDRLRLLKIINSADKWNNSISIDLPGDQLESLKHLRALDFSHTRIETLPDSIGSLKQLRYLNLTKSNVKKLPESVSNLYKLQTLELRDCTLLELPRGLKNLVDLRHLNFSNKNTCIPRGIGELINLQTLPIFNIKRGSWHCEISELKGLINLRGELTITGLENVSSVESVKESNLQFKRNLQSLTLHWSNGSHSGCNHFNEPSFEATNSYHEQHADLNTENIEEVLENLQPYTLLEELHINGYSGCRFPRWLGDASFSRLAKITLIGCGENCEVLPTLGLLPALKYLSIQWMYSVRRIGREFCSNSIEIKGFHLLQALEFKYMPNWVEWFGVEHGEFCRLHALRIVCCNQLQSLPQHLSSSLTKLLINNCGELSVIPYLPSLTKLTLSGELSESLLYNLQLPSLKFLKVACSKNITFLSLNGKSFASLEVLIIKGCHYLQSIVGVSSIAALKRLEIIRCNSLQISSDEEIPLLLQHLTIIRCHWLREWHQAVTAKFKNQLITNGFSNNSLEVLEGKRMEDSVDGTDNKFEVREEYFDAMIEERPRSVQEEQVWLEAERREKGKNLESGESIQGNPVSVEEDHDQNRIDLFDEFCERNAGDEW